MRNEMEALPEYDEGAKTSKAHLELYELTNRKQKRQESLEQFGRALRKLASSVKLGNEQQLQNVFIKGIRQAELKKEVARYTCQNKPASLEEQVSYQDRASMGNSERDNRRTDF